jgi:hypothetical protein
VQDNEITPTGARKVVSEKPRHVTKKSAYNERYDFADYTIEELSIYDDIDIVKPWQRRLSLVQPFSICFVFLAYSAYFSYRVWCNYQYRLVYGGLAEASWIFIAVEGTCLSKLKYSPEVESS